MTPQRYLFEARQMQALSLSVHIPLVCFGIAFPALVLFAEWRYLRTGDALYRTLARRWSKIMLALFAVGVVTGTILSFELGLLWPVWIQDFGNVFGLGFTLEGFSFFVEAIFIGIYVYGWDRLKPRLHFLCGLPIAIAGITGSMFVIAVNAWMNHPTGFTLRDGRAVDAHPWSALFANPFFWSEYVHMYFAAYIVCGFGVAGAYAWGFLRGRRGRYERTALTIALSAAAVASPLQVVVGDWAARDVAQAQPVKLAAMEGLATTTRGAAEHLLGWYNGHAVVYGIEIPRLLSLLAFHNPNAVVKGLDIVPLAGQPPVNVVRFAFQTMVGIGTLLALLGLVYLYIRLRRRRLPTARWFYAAVVLAGPLSVSATARSAWSISAWPARWSGCCAGSARSRWRSTSRREVTMLADVPMVFILVGLTAYTVLSGADFGAGFWTLIPGGGHADAATTREHTRHAIGPVWEANHVWLIFVLTVAWTCYPVPFGSIVSTLAIPLLIAAIGIIFRGTAYALRSQLEAGEGRAVRVVEDLFALSSVLTPFALATVIGAIATGRVPVGNARGDLITAWLNPTSVLAGVLAVAFSGYLAAVYLAADAHRFAERALVRDFRIRALAAGVVAGALALAGLLVVRVEARPLWDGLTGGIGLAMVCLCAVAGVATMILVWRSRFGLARASAALAVAAVIAGWAAAQEPRVLPGMTISQAAAGRATLIATIVGVAVGAAVLVPSLALLYSLVLRGRLDTAGAAAEEALPGVAEPGERAAAGDAGRGAPSRLSVAVAAGSLVIGAGLLVFAGPAWAHGVGAVLLLACAVTVFGMAVAPGEGNRP